METIIEIFKFIAILFSIVAAIFGCYNFIYQRGLKKGQRDITYSRDCSILENLYAPLLSLLLDIHISSCSLIRYGTFRQRFRHALEVFRERKYIKSKIKGGVVALFDRGISVPSVGIEYGPEFPISKIGDVIKKQAHLASPELISLYQRAAREEYERVEMSEDLISSFHLELAEHIFKQHELFANRVQFKK